MMIRRHVEASPEAIAAAELRMARAPRTRRHREPEASHLDPWAAPDIPDWVSVQVTRRGSSFAGAVRWGWWARTYAVDVLGSDGSVVRTKHTQHQAQKDVLRSLTVALTGRPTPASLVRDLSRSVWSLGGAAPVVAVAPYWQPPLPGL